MTSNFRIIFMGTPEFAVASLDILVRNGYSVVAVVTAPDRQAGRGLEMTVSDVKKYALSKGLPVLQPQKLKDENFLAELRSYQADLQVVVAFRMLPEVVWNMPRLGTINLHGSLLPQYRGAAPINRAVMNGEKETGVSTFFLQQQVDTGKIIFKQATPIGPNETAGEVHDRLMLIGAELLLKTVKAIDEGSYPQVDQQTLLQPGESLKEAPKIFKDDCRIQWNHPAKVIHDFIRGLSPYPGAHTLLISPEGKQHPLKLFLATPVESTLTPGAIHTDQKTFLELGTANGAIRVTELQLAGKRKMGIGELLRGFPITDAWTIV